MPASRNNKKKGKKGGKKKARRSAVAQESAGRGAGVEPLPTAGQTHSTDVEEDEDQFLQNVQRALEEEFRRRIRAYDEDSRRLMLAYDKAQDLRDESDFRGCADTVLAAILSAPHPHVYSRFFCFSLYTQVFREYKLALTQKDQENLRTYFIDNEEEGTLFRVEAAFTVGKVKMFVEGDYGEAADHFRRALALADGATEAEKARRILWYTQTPFYEGGGGTFSVEHVLAQCKEPTEFNLKQLSGRGATGPPDLRITGISFDPSTGEPRFDISVPADESHFCDNCKVCELKLIAGGGEGLFPCGECGLYEYCSKRCQEDHRHEEECNAARAGRDEAREKARRDARGFDTEAFAERAGAGWEGKPQDVRDAVLSIASAWAERGRDAVLLYTPERPEGRFLPLQFVGARALDDNDDDDIPGIEIRYVMAVGTEQKAKSFLHEDNVEDMEVSPEVFETISDEFFLRNWMLTDDKGEIIHDFRPRKVLHHTILAPTEWKARHGRDAKAQKTVGRNRDSPN